MKKSQDIMNMIDCKIFFYCFVLLTALTVKGSHILAEIYFIFLKKRPRPRLSNFRLKLCQRT